MLASTTLSALVVEKYLTLARADGGVDNAFSLELEGMQALVVEIEHAWQTIVQVCYGPT
ncbi:N-acetylneuraminate synthase family protein [Synechococcus sp. MIT S9452]|uniref:N-acetylneuraminate synthase family protein n=1 Tax=Synechococcus sp. MIT S9452 TaxID=3082546 RepID=UPI0039A4DE1F